MRFGSSTACLFLLLLLGCSDTPDAAGDASVTLEKETEAPAAAPSPDGPTVAPPERVAVRHILLEFSNDREREAAFSLARELEQKINNGEDMAQLAKKHSKDGTAPRVGFLGAAERGAWVQPFEDAAFALGIDEVSGPVETEYGVHILRREALSEVKLMHLLVAHKDAKNVAKKRSPVGRRTRAEALTMAEEALALLKEGSEFSEVAAQYSDTPMAKRGADLGWFVRGELGPAFDEVAFALDPGSHSEVFETVFGFHIILRME